MARAIRFNALCGIGFGLLLVTVIGPKLRGEGITVAGLPALTRTSGLPPGTPAQVQGTLRGTPITPQGFVVFERRRWDENNNSKSSSRWKTLERRLTPDLKLIGTDGDIRVVPNGRFPLDGEMKRITESTGGVRSTAVIENGQVVLEGLSPGGPAVAIGRIGGEGELLVDRLYGGTLSELVARDSISARFITWFGMAVIAFWLLVMGLTFVRLREWGPWPRVPHGNWLVHDPAANTLTGRVMALCALPGSIPTPSRM